MDEQEITEREEAAQAYAGETEEHFVNYCDACVDESREATKEVRVIWDQCWEAYNSKIDYGDKEDWQSKAVSNEPFTTVQQGKAVIRRALLRHDYLNVEGVEVGDKDFSYLIKKGLDFHCNEQHADFPTNFSIATDVSLAVGQSLEIIPSWENGKLILDLIEPWKIFRDPDAICMDPWSGMYWVHEEWMDIWKLKQANYENVDKIQSGGDDSDQRKAEQRKDYYYKRSDYRKFARVREFHGAILDSKGEFLLEGTYTVGGRNVIQLPQRRQLVRARWPGVSFSPLIHPLRFEGKGLMEGVITLWWLMNNLMNLDADNLNWVVNGVSEINIANLVDPSDLDEYPGKRYLKKTTDDVFRTHRGEAKTADILARMEAWSQRFQNGSFVNQFVIGSPGTRSNITKGEVEIKTQQSLGVFDSIGKDIEAGAVDVMWLIYETIMLNWMEIDTPSIIRVFGKEESNNPALLKFVQMGVDERKQLLRDNCDITVTGISAELQQLEMLEKLQIFMRLSESQLYSPYIKPRELLQAAAEGHGFMEPQWLLDDDEVKQLNLLKAQELYKTLSPEQQMALIGIVKDFVAQQGGMA